MGSGLSLDHHLQRFHVQHRLGQELFQLGVLGFQLLEPAGLRHLHPAELRSLGVKRRVTEAVLPAQLLDCHAGLGLLQEPDDLLFHKSLLHIRLPLRKRTLLASRWTGLLGAGQKTPLLHFISILIKSTSTQINRPDLIFRGEGAKLKVPFFGPIRW